MEPIIQILESNHNIVLHGAPGTGKTYAAKEIAKAMHCSKDQIGFVQIHYITAVKSVFAQKGRLQTHRRSQNSNRCFRA